MTKILYVEDNEDNIYMLSRRLKKRILKSSLQLTVQMGLRKQNWRNQI